jgi:hypothetical protein
MSFVIQQLQKKMVGSDIINGMENRQHRRRRRVEDDNYYNDTNGTTEGDDNFYDDSEDDEKGHRLTHNERIFKGSCSLGQFLLNPCRCMYNELLSCWWKFRKKQKQLDGRTVIKTTTVVILLLIIAPQTFQSSIQNWFSFSIRSSSSSSRRWSSIRPLNDRRVDRIPVRIPIFDQNKDETDIGGWKQFRKFFLPVATIIDVTVTDHKEEIEPYKNPNFGALQLHDNPPYNNLTYIKRKAEQEERLARSILSNDEEIAEKYWQTTHIDRRMKSYYEPAESLEDRRTRCRRPSWKNRYYPSCNAFHEADLSRDYNADQAKTLPGYDQLLDSFFLSHGYYRDVWVLHNFDLEEKSILKTTRWKHNYGRSTYLNTLMDAQVMERMTNSPRIVTIYGHCGSAVWVEAMSYEVEEIIIHGDGYLKQGDRNDGSPLESFSAYTPAEKLNIAIQMAESIADLHGFADGIM